MLGPHTAPLEGQTPCSGDEALLEGTWVAASLPIRHSSSKPLLTTNGTSTSSPGRAKGAWQKGCPLCSVTTLLMQLGIHIIPKLPRCGLGFQLSRHPPYHHSFRATPGSAQGTGDHMRFEDSKLHVAAAVCQVSCSASTFVSSLPTPL